MRIPEPFICPGPSVKRFMAHCFKLDILGCGTGSNTSGGEIFD
jgi:hypothetical protein